MISNRCHYALRAMLELALREGSGPVTIADIATAQKIPARFLEAIMRQLKQAGLTDSMRGKEGGYFLARPAGKIHVGAVLSIFEGPLFTESEQRGPHAIVENEQDVFSRIWHDAESALNRVFAESTFERLADQERRRRFSTSADYSI